MPTFLYLAVTRLGKIGSSDEYHGIAGFRVGADGGLVKLAPFVYPCRENIQTLAADSARRLLYLFGDAYAPALARVEVRSDGSLGAARPTTFKNDVALHPNGKRAYALRRGSLVTYHVSADGEKRDRVLLATRVAPPDTTSDSESLAVHPNGERLFVGVGRIITVKLDRNGDIVPRGAGESRPSIDMAEDTFGRLVTDPTGGFVYSSSYGRAVESARTFRRYRIGAEGKLSEEKRATKDGEEGFCLCFCGDGRAAFTLKELFPLSMGGAFIDQEWIPTPAILQWQVDKNGLFRPNVSKLSDKTGEVKLRQHDVNVFTSGEGGMVSVTLP